MHEDMLPRDRRCGWLHFLEGTVANIMVSGAGSLLAAGTMLYKKPLAGRVVQKK